MINKVFKYISENGMINRKDKVLIALSGGPDSVAMVHILHSLQGRMGFLCYAAHVNHCLRGEEADGDEAYAKALCEKLNIPFYSKKVDIKGLAEERGISLEMAGREARYEFFNELRDKLNLDKVAVAHNANDQAETILMRIMRGTGLEGLGGIKAVREGGIIRPILCLSREEVETYCQENSLDPRIDKSNLQELYLRNKIRLKVIPYMKENFNEEIISALNRLGELVEADNAYINIEAEKFYNSLSRKNEKGIYLDREAFNLHISILRRIIKKACGSLKGDELNISKQHIDDIIALKTIGTGKSVNLPGGIKVINEYGELFFTTIEEGARAFQGKEIILKREEITKLLQGDSIEYNSQGFSLKLTLRLIDKNSSVNLKSSKDTKYFDFNKISGDILLRTREDGDKFNPLGMQGRKKLKDIFIDQKIPRDKRDNIPLLCFGKDIAWIMGYKISNKFRVDDNTQRLLQINLKERN